MSLGVIHVYHGDGERVREAILAKAPSRCVVVLPDEEAFRDRLGDVEILFTSAAPRGHWRRAGRLRLVQAMGAGVDDLLPAPELPGDVALTSLRGVFATEVAEAALALVLALVRGVPTLVRQQDQGKWRPFASRTLAGRTMGILGQGAVGRKVAHVAAAFGMYVATFSRREGSLDDVLRVSDVLVVCLPRTPETLSLVDRSALGKLPPGALVINVGRGGVIDEPALLEALQTGEVGGAALDVFAQEPLAATSPWWTAPNTIVSPHQAGLGVRYLERAAEVLLENVRRLDAGEELLHRVDRARGY